MILTGDCLDVLPTLEAESVQCCVTSPPYYGLRDYGTASWEGGDPGCDHIDDVAAAEQRRNRKGLANNADENDGATRSREVQNGIDKAFQYKASCPKCGATRVDSQIGLEPTPEAYVEKLVSVFREVRRVLRGDGTVWLNLGDSYVSNASSQVPQTKCHAGSGYAGPNRNGMTGLKPKDLIGIPWRVAFALQADGWWLRSEIIWAKANPMPESVTDRPTKSHEQIFLLSKNARYYYDAETIKEPCLSGPSDIQKMNESLKRIGGKHKDLIDPLSKASSTTNIGIKRAVGDPSGRNRRSVWNINTVPFPGSHFAVFPPAIPEICIKAGSKPGDTVLDPFSGAGTTGLVAEKLGRKYIGIDLNPDYVAMSEKRIYEDCGGLGL